MSSNSHDDNDAQHHETPSGVVCDPVTGVCRMPPRNSDGLTPSLIPLPKNLRSFDVLEDENGNKVDASALKGKVRLSVGALLLIVLI